MSAVGLARGFVHVVEAAVIAIHTYEEAESSEDEDNNSSNNDNGNWEHGKPSKGINCYKFRMSAEIGDTRCFRIPNFAQHSLDCYRRRWVGSRTDQQSPSSYAGTVNHLPLNSL